MNEDIHTYIEPELEARITALVLGEASEFEADELEKLLKEKPELAIFRRRMQAMHELLGEAVKPEPDENWQLSSERRASLKNTLTKSQPATTQKKSRIVDRHQWRSAVSIAACLLVCVVLFAFMTPLYKSGSLRKSESQVFEPEIISYSAPSEEKGADESFGLEEAKQSMFSSREDRDLEELPMAGSLFRQDGVEIMDSKPPRPSVPSSSQARVIAANEPSAKAIPVPEVEARGMWLDFGNGDDFGDGWGGGGGSGHELGYNWSSEKSERDGRVAGRDGDRFESSTAFSGVAGINIAGVVDAEGALFERGNEIANNGKKVQKPTATPLFPLEVADEGDHLKDANLALAQKYRRIGKYKEARNVLGAIIQENPTNEAALKQLEYLDDPIRTNPALTYEHTKKVEQVRKNLYLADGYLNLGNFDKAEDEMKKVLKVDPYNRAARRGLEKIAAAQSDFYRAAYDQTRAELRAEVDSAWELSVGNSKLTKSLVSEARHSKELQGLNQNIEEKSEGLAKQRQQLMDAVKELQKKSDTQKELKPRQLKPLPDEILTRAQPFSTFSLNVSDVSFKLAKASLLEKGQWPDAAKVRTEEFVNAFNYGDPSPSRDEQVSCAIEQSAHPFLQQRNLLRIGMKTASSGRSAPLRLTVLLDNSGSMEREDREASVLAAIEVLAGQLGAQDVITLVGFASKPRLLADRLSGDQAAKLVQIVANTPSEGGTNLEEALRLARSLALRQRSEGAQDRVVLITDGVANLGNTVPAQLAAEIETMRQQGIAFDACGVGAEGLNDDILESLTRKGDGRYYFLNRAEDADAGFVKQLAGALSPAAKNVKVQVKFNPNRVSQYRLLGFEKHRLNKKDFRNDQVDAAEMAAEEAGNAVYQIQVNPNGAGELGEVFVRFLDTKTNRMVERSWPLPYEPQAKSFDQAAPSMQLAGTAAMLGEKLHGTDAGSVRFSTISGVLGQLRGHYSEDPKVQDLIRMCQKVK